MDSYDIFGEDGSGMLEGLADLAGADNFSDGAAPSVAAGPRDASNQSYQTSYSQPSVQQESSLQKLASFGGAGGGAPAPDGAVFYRGAGGGPPAPQQAYSAQPQYQHEAMYSMPEQPQHHAAMSDIGGWPGGAGPVRGYPPAAQSYRHPHPYNQPKLHQYPQQQSSAMGLQAMAQSAGYLQRQPHYAQQPQPAQMYPQSYPGYSQIHSQTVSRMSQHMPYHQQMDINPHQYSHMHSQQPHPSLPPHQGHPPIPNHQNLPPGHPAPSPHQVMPPHPSQSHPGQSHPGQSHPGQNHPGQGHPNVPPHQALTAQSHGGASIPGPGSHSGVNHPSQLPPVASHQSQSVPNHPPNTHPSIPPNQAPHPSHPVHQSIHGNQNIQSLASGGLPSVSGHPNPTLSNVPNIPSSHSAPSIGSIHQSPQGLQSGPAHGPQGSNPNQQQMGHLPPYGQAAPHPMSMAYGPHGQVQRNLDISVSTGGQYQPSKQLLESGSPQYRTSFPQLSPQMSPRAQMSPRQQPSQMSPRPVMSPAKPPNMSPHPHMQNTLSPRPPAPPTNKTSSPVPPSAYPQQSTLQALEQMVMPSSVPSGGGEYAYPRNPMSPAVGPRMPVSPQHWNQVRAGVNVNGSSVVPPEGVQSASSSPAVIVPPFSKTPDVVSENKQIIDVPENNPPLAAPVIELKPPEEQVRLENQENLHAKENYTSSPNENSSETLVADNLASSKTDNTLEEHDPTPNLKDGDSQHSNNSQESLNSVEDKDGGTAKETSPQQEDRVKVEELGALQNSGQPTLPVTEVQSASGAMASPVSTALPPMTSQETPVTVQSLVPINPPVMTSSNSVNNKDFVAPCLSGSPIMAQVPGVNLNMQTGQINPQQNTTMITNLQPTINLNPTMGPLGMQTQFENSPMIGGMGLLPRNQNMANIQMTALAPNLPLMGTGLLPHQGMAGAFPGPISHHQERAALQQQIQEIFCMPPLPENQEKVRRLQERLNLLQQHESNDKCNGGPQCLLQNPMYSAMIDSPQVTSTTGRGRTKGPPKPRKPRVKKADKLTSSVPTPAVDQLPVSEDCVTAGTGLIVSSAMIDMDESVDLTNISDTTVISSDISKDGKPKKARSPRKPRERKPRPPKEPKPPKVPREKAPKQPREKKDKDPNAPKKRRYKKRHPGEGQADTTTNSELNNSTTDLDQTVLSSDISMVQSPGDKSESIVSIPEIGVLPEKIIDGATVTDFDDIPVSKIPIKDLLEEAEAKREREEREDDTDSTLNTPTKKRSSGSRNRRSGGGITRKMGKKLSGGRRRKKGALVPESDGEPDDMMATPPPSPPVEGDCDSSKRRSARNTQRKKYTDDVMLRLSDEEYSLIPKVRDDKDSTRLKEAKSKDVKDLKDPEDNSESTPKPNYIYINTTDEDSMIVQHVLACRIAKREMVLPAPEAKTEIKMEEDDIDTKIKEEEAGENEDEAENSTITKDLDNEETNDSELKSVDAETSKGADADVASVEETSVDSIKVETDTENNKTFTVDNDLEDNSQDQVESIQDDNISEQTDQPVDDVEEKLDEDAKLKEKDEIKPVVIKQETSDERAIEVKEKGPPVMVDVEEYFIKYRNFSYLHCEWKTEEELYKGDKRIFSKIKRFKLKQAQQLNIFDLFDDEHFNPDYVEVERVLDMSEQVDPATNKKVKHYLVKWKSLQYEDCTWELEEDVEITKIQQFQVFTEVPPKDKWKYKRKPNPDQWVQLKESPLYKGGNTLRPYQLEGLNWLLFSWFNNRNCILADEMGLGKTIQSLTFINSVWEYGLRGPFLVIAPLSTIPNWQRELENWTDMNVIVYHGSQQSKSMIQEYEFYYKNEKGGYIKDITKFNVLITTFEIIVTDFQDLRPFNWRLCVIDEAHRLKNRNCKLLEGLRQLHLEHRVLLSGTPLQNNVNELFSLLNFLEPSQFSSSEAFLTEFGQLKSESEVLKLQALLKPMMLRRLKDDVEKSLAPKEETIVEVELTNIQKKYYRGILERNFSFLSKGTASAANIPNLMNTMMELRKCCIHPYLLNGAEDQIQYDYKQAHGEDHEAYYKALIKSSGKMVLVDKLLPKLKAGGHRVLIFSQMVRCLDILEDYLMYRKYPYERIDGRIRGNLRQEAIDRFSKPDSDRFVFLLCTKAGGLGINLTAADTVIIYDSDWNPQNDLQAQARCHRIGQQKMVKIYRLICCNTYEREMFDKASMKLGLDKAILQSMNTAQGGKDPGSKQLSKKEIEDLLKKGAYGAVMDEDNAGDKFCEEDIEMILARRTLVIQMESEKGSTFSKASFAATDQRCDIDIRDPDFWNKWAKKAEIDTTEKKEDDDLMLTEPRRRTQIKRYGHDDALEMSDMEVTPDTDDDGDGIGLRSKKKKDKYGKKGKRSHDDYIPRSEAPPPIDEEVVYGTWARSECFKIERGLLTYGWARWDEIIDKNQFRRGWTPSVIEDCARIIVLYCLRHYKGDEKIRNFIWDLIEPCENGEVTISRNHSGLHNPVPRGRNAKKKVKPKDGKEQKQVSLQKWEDPNHWSSAEKYDCENYLESSYKKHLYRHANKVLLRVRMMYYIKHEVIGEYAQQIESGVPASALGMVVPRGVESVAPRAWWDAACDVSLLVGTYLHGYENYLPMRTDPQLVFLDKLGPPDAAECTNIKNEDAMMKISGVEVDEDGDGEASSGAGRRGELSDASPPPSPYARADDDSTQGSGGAAYCAGQWPSMQDLNTRLRRLITSYQRNYKKEELKMQQRAKKQERRERMEQLAREEAAQWRWARADEEAFRRTVASYGVEFEPATKSLRWARFRALARLDAKSDEALTDYLKAFMAMCKRQCGLAVGEAELPTRADLRAEPIGEERAIATLERIDLLRVLREEVASHPALDARLTLCEVNEDTPPWWIPGRHDKLLVLGVCKHGLGDTYHKLFCDPKLPFADCARKWSESRHSKSKPESSKSGDLSDDNESEPSVSQEHESSPGDEQQPALRRSKRNSNTSDKDRSEEEGGSALSELERLARVEERPPATARWWTERALETRLHHIAHAVQNGEWAGGGRVPHERRRPRKHHIAIDVETERAKLHALLSTPPQPPPSSHTIAELPPSLTVKSTSGTGWERDDASSDSGSRRSTPAPPAPPPAHQRHPPTPTSTPTPAPIDLSAPLDLSDVHDFSAKKTSTGTSTPSPSSISIQSQATNSSVSTKGKLDDMLSKLMKRKNVPEPELIVGKEKKRKKLDEIVLGLSAAKVQSAVPPSAPSELQRKTTILPNVTVTPAAPPSSSPAPPPAQKPFSVTVTSVPSPQGQPKDLSSFLQQSLEQQVALLKQHKQGTSATQRKQYESLLAEATKSMDHTRSSAYSHEAKVNKWLAEQAGLEEARRRRASTLQAQEQRRPTGEEHVPMVHRLTGKRLAGHKAPTLKQLAQWIAENPMYDMDPKWAESLKETVKYPPDVRSQRPSSVLPSTSGTNERKKGRPPLMDPGSNPAMSSGTGFSGLSSNLSALNPSLLASLSGLNAFDPKTLASTLANLSSFDPKSLGSFDPKLLASLSNFDAKNNPLLMPFNSMPNMLNNMAGGNVFANLAGLGLTGFPGVDMTGLGVPTSSADTSGSKGKSRKGNDGHGASGSGKGSMPTSTASQFPFLFPNPNLLYPQLGLGGMNPFGMQSSVSSAYADALAQCGLLNGGMSGAPTSTMQSTAHSATRTSSKSTPSRSASVTSSSSTMSARQQKPTLERQQQAQLQQLLLPHDTYLTKQASTYEAALKAEKRSREAERRDAPADLSKPTKAKTYDSFRAQLPPEFAAMQERLMKSAKGDKKDVDIGKMLFEQMASGALSASLVSASQPKRAKDPESKDAFEKLSKTSAEYIARSLAGDEQRTVATASAKRPRQESGSEPENLALHSGEGAPVKKMREAAEQLSTCSSPHSNAEQPLGSANTSEMDLEELIAPSTVVRSGPKPAVEEEKSSEEQIPVPEESHEDLPTEAEKDATTASQEDIKDTSVSEQIMSDRSRSESKESHNESSESQNANDEPSEGGGKKQCPRKRGKKSEESASTAAVRRELRSSAGRQAAAAAARHAAQAAANSQQHT